MNRHFCDICKNGIDKPNSFPCQIEGKDLRVHYGFYNPMSYYLHYQICRKCFLRFLSKDIKETE